MPEDKILASRFLATVSTGPGVYLMQGSQEVLYVGKAINLRKRLASYRRFEGQKHTKTGVMLARVRKIETILTTTEKEALILEASLIKKHRPRYNVILRDDKNYPLIKVTVKDKWPRIIVTRRRIRDGNRYFGPYASTTAMRETLKLLQALFPLRRCPRVRSRARPCLNFQLGQCLAPCSEPVADREYRVMVEGAIKILEGRNREFLTELHGKMQHAAQSLDFESAARIRDQIKGLERTLENQVIASDHARDQDVFGLVRKDVSAGIAILFVRAGILTGARSFFVPDPIGTDSAILAESIIQFYSPERQPPAEILLPLVPDDSTLLQERLGELRDGAVKIVVPRRGRKMQLTNMARRNARQVFEEKDRRQESWASLAAALQKSLHLSREPSAIECVDISNFSGKQAVGSLVSFHCGVHHKKGYRHYRIREKAEPDDYAMMREVLLRRLAKGKSEKDLPDLLLLDGGKGQLNLAQAVLEELGLTGRIDLAALAKDKNGSGERIFRPGRKNHIPLPNHAPVLLFLMRIRDEAHRFGITHHRRLRTRNTLTSELDRLSGIGPKRRQLLLKTYGSIKRIREAPVTDLAKIPGIGPSLAAAIHNQLHAADEA